MGRTPRRLCGGRVIPPHLQMSSSCFNSDTGRVGPGSTCPNRCCYYGRCGTSSECGTGGLSRADILEIVGCVLALVVLLACLCSRRRWLHTRRVQRTVLLTPPPAVFVVQQQTMAVQLPPNALPGTQMTVMAPSGQPVAVTIPHGATPGSVIQVQVPLQPLPQQQQFQQVPQQQQQQQPSAPPPTTMTDVPMAMPVAATQKQ